MEATKKKIGRPTTSPKNTMIRVRMDDETIKKMDSCAKKLNTTRSEIIRNSIVEFYQKMNK
ncbi:ribbon-helix-helix protein, CopG family [Megamonas hypermegale]|uniref:ribbon-helix-helix protein, CopG family n=1 Tax=Megamonas hypermegale TaxID=158847 RepID=UPI0026EECE29|nr:ribbon-helix-helix protein, CopG family [Megamonas hypermegale]